MRYSKIKHPELLSPAGNYEKLKTALLYGADAVYVGGRHFGMRSAADNFSDEELDKAVRYTHEWGRRIYVAVNTMPRAGEYPELRRYLSALSEIKPDALIVADLGVLEEARATAPDLDIHISTQASIVSPAAALAYAKLGAARVVLARELCFEEIRAIRRALPEEVEIEAFVHGSMCVSYSGRCLLSNHLVARDANRGECAQPCRWNYVLYEEKRPNTAIPVEESPLGTFVMSSKDMCMIEHIPELVESGINSFKIEGRIKSAYYAAVVTNAYRMAIDEYISSSGTYKYNAALLGELESVSHREYCTGYYFDRTADTANLVSTPGYMREKAYYATALEMPQDGTPKGLEREKGEGALYRFIQRNKLTVGSTAEIITPGRVGRGFTVREIYDESGAPIEAAPHPAMIFYTRVPFPVTAGDIMRAGSN